MNKQEILNFLLNNKDYILQHKKGLWKIKSTTSNHIFRVEGRSARYVCKELKCVASGEDFSEYACEEK